MEGRDILRMEWTIYAHRYIYVKPKLKIHFNKISSLKVIKNISQRTLPDKPYKPLKVCLLKIILISPFHIYLSPDMGISCRVYRTNVASISHLSHVYFMPHTSHPLSFTNDQAK
jgi:hypothetical protein